MTSILSNIFFFPSLEDHSKGVDFLEGNEQFHECF